MTASKKPGTRPFVGRWRITEMEQWPQDYVDLIAPGHITIKAGQSGELQFGAIIAWIDYRIEKYADDPRIEFSWDGDTEVDPICGRGWASIQGGKLHGRLFIHDGDDSWFIATKDKRAI